MILLELKKKRTSSMQHNAHIVFYPSKQDKVNTTKNKEKPAPAKTLLAFKLVFFMHLNCKYV